MTGDSITHGRHGDFTWRYRFDKELTRQGVAIDLVGSLTTPYVDPGYPTSQYANPNFDRDHFAKAGWQLRDMVGQVGPEVVEQQPDVIVLAAGINDLLRGRTPEETATSLRSWIENARGAKASVRIVLSQVLHIDVADREAVNPQISAYNLLLQGVAAEMSTADSPITVADTDRGWEPVSWTFDGIHPTPTGQTHVAQRVAEEFRELGLLPQVPQVFRTVAWSRTIRPGVKVVGTRATVSWSRQAITGARVYVHRIGRAGVMLPRLAYSSGSHTFTLVRGATYDFRIQLRRQRVTGPWGAITRVRVPLAPRPAAPARVTVNGAGCALDGCGERAVLRREVPQDQPEALDDPSGHHPAGQRRPGGRGQGALGQRCGLLGLASWGALREWRFRGFPGDSALASSACRERLVPPLP